MQRSPSRLSPLALALAALGTAASAYAVDTTRVIVAFQPGAAAHARAAVAMARGSVKLELPGLDAIAIEVPTVALGFRLTAGSLILNNTSAA